MTLFSCISFSCWCIWYRHNAGVNSHGESCVLYSHKIVWDDISAGVLALAYLDEIVHTLFRVRSNFISFHKYDFNVVMSRSDYGMLPPHECIRNVIFDYQFTSFK